MKRLLTALACLILSSCGATPPVPHESGPPKPALHAPEMPQGCLAAMSQLIERSSARLVLFQHGTDTPNAELLETLNRLTGGKLQVRTFNLDSQASMSDPEAQELRPRLATILKPEKEATNALVIIIGAEEKWVLGWGNSYGPRYSLATNLFTTEVQSKGERRRIAILSGPGSLTLADPNVIVGEHSPSTQLILGNAFPYFEFQELRADQLPASDASGLIIGQPGQELTEGELKAIDAFLMAGSRSLVVLAGAVNTRVEQGGLKTWLSTQGLNHLLEKYGLRIQEELVVDPDSSMEIKAITDSGSAMLPFPSFTQLHGEGTGAHFSAASPYFLGMWDMVVPFPSSVVSDPTRQPRARFRTLAWTSANAVSCRTEQLIEGHNLLSLEAPCELDPTKRAVRQLAVSVEGQLRSAFGSASARARIFVMASPQVQSNPFARAGNQMDEPSEFASEKVAHAYAQLTLTSNILAIKNILDWMVLDEPLLACAPQAAHPGPPED